MDKIFCMFFIWVNFCSTVQARVSLIIPCSYKHAYLLDELLELYEMQTVLPDEVVIALSEANKVSNEIIYSLQNKDWIFPVKLLLYYQQLYAGQNRNNACRNASGDIFICQDADDVPHPQRIEIIKYFFETHSLDHLIHLWVESKEFESFSRFDVRTVPFVFPSNFNHAYYNVGKIHNGNIGLAHHVFKKIEWSSMPKGQDVDFNKKVYDSFKACVVLGVPLVIYRNELSSWKKRKDKWKVLYNEFHENLEIGEC